MSTGLQLGGRAVGNDAAFIQENHAVGDQKSAREFMGDNNNSDPKSFFQFEQQLVDSRGDDRIEACRRLIKKKNFRIHGHGAGYRCALFHSAAQLRGHVIFIAA